MVFTLPGVIFLAVFALYPLVLTIVNSFRNVTVLGLMTGNMPGVGFDNYVQVLKDPMFWESTWRAVIFTVACVSVQFTLGLVLAVLLNKRFKGRGVLRTVLMVPWVVPIVVTGAVFKWMFTSGNGLVNTVIRMFGGQGFGWLEKPGSAFLAVIIANIWLGFPFAMQNLSAALENIPVSVVEASMVDGANAQQRFLRITLPMIRGPIAILLTLQTIYTFNVFELILAMTGGGPAGGTTVVTYYAYQKGFEFFQLGPASAAVVLLMVLLGVFAAIYVRLSAEDGRS